MASVQPLKWGGVTDEEANASATARAEEVLAGLQGRREELGYKCTLDRSFSVVTKDYEKRKSDLLGGFDASKGEQAQRKAARKEAADRSRAAEEAEHERKVAEEEADAIKRAADPVYAAKRMAEDEAAAFQRLVEEKREIEAQFAAAENKEQTAASERLRQQEAAKASLEMLEREKKKQKQQEKNTEESGSGSVLLAYQQAKESLARKEKAKLQVAPVETRGAIKMSFGKKSLF